MKVTNVKFAGLGGMGVVKASDIFADVVFRLGHDVKKAEVHGMSQRGGSVASDVRFGEHVESPMIPERSVDYLVVFEPSQVAVYQGELAPGGVLLASDAIPMERLSNKKALNVALLGALSSHFDFPLPLWLEALRDGFPAKLHAPNERAFALGREFAR